jgi:hypothetical protein
MANHFGVSARFIKTLHDSNVFVGRCHSRVRSIFDWVGIVFVNDHPLPANLF